MNSQIPARAPFFSLGLIVLIASALALTRDYAVPIALGILVWFLINALAATVRNRARPFVRISETVSQVIGSVLLFLAILIGINLLSAGLAELAQDAVDREGTLMPKLQALLAHFEIGAWLNPREILARFDFEGLITGALQVASDLISDVSLVFLYALFLLIDERFYMVKLEALFPEPGRRAGVRATLIRIGETTRVYLWLMSLISAGVALVTFAVCAAVGLKGAGVWAVLAFLLNFVPTIGSILAVLLPAIYGLATLSDPWLVATLIGVLGMMQFLAGEIVVPRVMGNRLNLSSFVILLALIVWGALWGPVGMFLAIPITVIMVLIFSQFQALRPIAIALSKDANIPAMRTATGLPRAAE